MSIYKKLRGSKPVGFTCAVVLNLIFVVGLFVKIFYFQFSSKLNATPFLSPQNNNLYMAVIGSVLMVYAVVFLLSFKKPWIVLCVVYFLFSILLFGDLLYSRYYESPLTVTVVVFQFWFVHGVKDSIFSLIKWKDIIFFIDLPLAVFCTLFAVKLSRVHFKWRALSLGLVAIFSYFCVMQVYSRSNTASYQWFRNNMTRDLGVFCFHYNDVIHSVKQLVNKKLFISNEERAAITSRFYPQQDNAYTGIGEGKNLIVVQLEAFQSFVVGKSVLGKEITPNINALIQESVYASNMYHQVFQGNTSDAEFLANTGLYPARNGAAYYLYPQNEYISLAQLLQERQYFTAASHAYVASFWNRTEMYRSLGFQAFYSQADFDPVETVGMGLSDEAFFRQTLDKLLADGEGKPFYSFLVTLASHHPYNAFSHWDFALSEQLQGTMTGDFIKAASYVDYCIGYLVALLKEKGLYEDTVLAFYGDHSALFDDQRDVLTEFLNISDDDVSWQQIQQVPFVVHVPGMSRPAEISTVSGQVDILPTLANIMGLSHPFMFGQDLLNGDRGFAVLPRGIVITDDYLCFGAKDRLYTPSGELSEDYPLVKEEIETYMSYYDTSCTVLEGDMLRFFIEDGK